MIYSGDAFFANGIIIKTTQNLPVRFGAGILYQVVHKGVLSLTRRYEFAGVAF